jgi:D-lactate dehydrogenase
MRLLAFDPYPSAAALELGVEYVDLTTLFSESDVISALPADAGKLSPA